MIATSLDKRVHLTTSLGWAGDDTAQHYLKEMKRRADPILHARQWRILELREFYPKSKQLLGLNVNHGQEVCVRLRDPGNRARFLPFEAAMGTLLHEMAHCAISPHNAAFWALYKDLVADCERREVAMVLAGGEGKSNAGTVAAQQANGASSALVIPRKLKPFSGAGRPLGGTVRIDNLEALREARAELLCLRRPILSLRSTELVTEENAHRGSCGLSQGRSLDGERSNDTGDTNEGPTGSAQWQCTRCGHFNVPGFVFCEVCADDKWVPLVDAASDQEIYPPRREAANTIPERMPCDDDEPTVIGVRKRPRNDDPTSAPRQVVPKKYAPIDVDALGSDDDDPL